MKLSVITINLNNADGLQKTLKSVADQRFRDFEQIVIDGGSDDDSNKVIAQFKDHITYSVSESDTGIYNAMNKGILRAIGEYCFFLNSGDTLTDSDVFGKVFSQPYSEDILFGNMLVFLNSEFEGRCVGKETLTFLDIYNSIIKHQAAFIRRELLLKYGLYNEKLKIIADWEFFLRTAGFGNASYRYIDTDISNFDNGGISNNSGDLVVRERRAVISEYIPEMMRPDFEDLSLLARYKNVTGNKLTFFILRAMTKTLRLFNK